MHEHTDEEFSRIDHPTYVPANLRWHMQADHGLIYLDEVYPDASKETLALAHRLLHDIPERTHRHDL